MQSAPAGVFRAGGVVHADIDLACGRAFVGAGGSAGGIGTETDPVYTADKPSLAPLASPALTGIPTAPTAASGTATTQLATTEFVATAIEEADVTPSAAFAMVPDYASQETVNRISTANGTWTADRDGFVHVLCNSTFTGARVGILVNGVRAFSTFYSVEATLAVRAGDVVALDTNSSYFHSSSYYYIPPKYVPVNRGYSTDEQLTGETWIDGKPIYRIALTALAPGANSEKRMGALPVVPESIVKMWGMANLIDGRARPIPDHFSLVFYNLDDNSIYITNISAPGLTNAASTIFVEYTKP